MRMRAFSAVSAGFFVLVLATLTTGAAGSAARAPTGVRPVIEKPTTVPATPTAGKRLAVSFRVTRSDTGKPLLRGKMICDPSVAGKMVAHVESFRGGIARLSFVVPETATMVKVRLTVSSAGRSATRIASLRVLQPPRQSLSIGYASVVEGNQGTTTLSFPVTLSAASGQTVSVAYATADGTAVSSRDYAGMSGRIVFAPGSTATSVTVPVNGDSDLEPDETLTVTLSGPVNATIATGSATGTIRNDDGAICLVTDAAGLNDHGWNALANQGLLRAASELGVRTRVLESASAGDYLPNLARCATAGYDLIFSAGPFLADATREAAGQYPAATFAIVDYAYPVPLPNIRQLTFRAQEAGYLAGYLAALMTRSGTISTVGGVKYTGVDRWVAGFEAGAKAAKPGIGLLRSYSNTFVDQAVCRQVALDQIARGSDIVFNVAGACGLGTLAAAAERGVSAIGVDVDQAYLGEHILTSATIKVDEAVFRTIEMLLHDQPLGGGTTSFGLAQAGVGLGPTSHSVPQAILDQVDQQRVKIVTGQIQPPSELP